MPRGKKRHWEHIVPQLRADIESGNYSNRGLVEKYGIPERTFYSLVAKYNLDSKHDKPLPSSYKAQRLQPPKNPIKPHYLQDVTFLEFVYIWGQKCEFPQWVIPKVHLQIIEFLGDHKNWENQRGVLQAFRYIGKSTLVALFIVWMLVLDPELQFMIISAGHDLAKKMVKDCKNVIIRHPLAQHLRPSTATEKENSWSATEFYVKGSKAGRNPSVVSFGVASQQTGSHADWAILDDVEVPNTVKTAELREKTKTRIQELGPILGEKGKALFVGTPHTWDDIYSEEIKHGCSHIKIPAMGILEGEFPNYTSQKYSWPERFPEDAMLKLQRECRVNWKFMSQYMLDASQAVHSRLDPSDIDKYDAELSLKLVNGRQRLVLGKDILIKSLTAWWDPAGGQKNRDDSVLATVLTSEDGHIYIHDATKVNDENLQNQCLKIKESILKYHIDKVCVETNGLGHFAPNTLRQMTPEFKDLKIIKRRSTQRKSLRIGEAFEVPLVAGIIHAHERVMDGKFPQQLSDFDGQDRGSGSDDYIDSVAGAINEENPKVVRRGDAEAKLDRPQWRDQKTCIEIERDYAQ
jgi:hypothetical protein